MTKWISVDIALPPSDEIVLCKTSAPKGSYPEYIISFFEGKRKRWTDIWGYVATHRTNDMHEITHWCEIPSPPEQEE